MCMKTHKHGSGLCQQTCTFINPHFMSNLLLSAAPHSSLDSVTTLLQPNVINEVFAKGINLQEAQISPQHTPNRGFFNAASTCNRAQMGLFLFGSLFCRRRHEGQGHPSVLKASGYFYQYLCAPDHRLVGSSPPHGAVKRTELTFCKGFGIARAFTAILKILLKKYLVSFSLAEI